MDERDINKTSGFTEYEVIESDLIQVNLKNCSACNYDHDGTFFYYVDDEWKTTCPDTGVAVRMIFAPTEEI